MKKPLGDREFPYERGVDFFYNKSHIMFTKFEYTLTFQIIYMFPRVSDHSQMHYSTMILFMKAQKKFKTKS